MGTAITSSESADKQGQDIIVTGTNISGVKPVGSQTISIDRAQVLASGYTNVNDVLQTLPQVQNNPNSGGGGPVYRQGGTSGYAAANGARNALTREWAVELLPYGIRVNAVIVAECWTPMYEQYLQALSNPNEKLKEIVKNIPLEQRMTTTAEIANTVVFLLSSASSHTTGQLIHVDGGYTHLDRVIK